MKRLISQLLCGLVFICSGFMELAQAGTFSISPLRTTLSAGKKVGSLTVINQGNEPTTVQLEVMSWSQTADGQDELVLTKDILANPPIFTLPPRGKQVIRVGLRKPPSASAETTYRLIVRETPPPLKPNFTGLNFALRVSVPIFVLPQGSVQAKTSWQLKQGSDGLLRLIAENTGTAHIQVINFSLQPTALEKISTQLVYSYLLPNQKREWVIKNTNLAIGTKVHLSAETDVEPIEADLVVQ